MTDPLRPVNSIALIGKVFFLVSRFFGFSDSQSYGSLRLSRDAGTAHRYRPVWGIFRQIGDLMMRFDPATTGRRRESLIHVSLT
jgi:hypothetical protein